MFDWPQTCEKLDTPQHRCYKCGAKDLRIIKPYNCVTLNNYVISVTLYNYERSLIIFNSVKSVTPNSYMRNCLIYKCVERVTLHSHVKIRRFFKHVARLPLHNRILNKHVPKMRLDNWVKHDASPPCEKCDAPPCWLNMDSLKSCG